MIVLVKILLTFSLLFSSYSQGTQLYEFFSQRCCEGTVQNVTDLDLDSNYDCCGSEVYKVQISNETSTDLVSRCCRNKLYENVNSTTYCCGTDLYDIATRACYQWGEDEFEAVILTPDNIKNGENQVCGKSKGKRECYNPKKKICCSGALYERKEHMHCCGDRYIDTKVSKCCVDYVKDEKTKNYTKMTSVIYHNGITPKRSKCCNGTVIDADNQECCAGAAVNFTQSSYKYAFNILYDDYSEDFAQDLSAELLDFRGSGCCGRELVTDEEMQVCVDNERVVNKDHRNQVYCAGRLRNVSGDEPVNVYCVEGRVVELRKNQSFCLVDKKKELFNVTQKVCGVNELIEMTEDDEEIGRRFACYKSGNGLYLSSFVYPDLVYYPSVYFQTDYLENNETFEFNNTL